MTETKHEIKLDGSQFGCEWCGFAKRTLSPERRIAYTREEAEAALKKMGEDNEAD